MKLTPAARVSIWSTHTTTLMAISVLTVFVIGPPKKAEGELE
jgi:hypothetical protein